MFLLVSILRLEKVRAMYFVDVVDCVLMDLCLLDYDFDDSLRLCGFVMNREIVDLFNALL